MIRFIGQQVASILSIRSAVERDLNIGRMFVNVDRLLSKSIKHRKPFTSEDLDLEANSLLVLKCSESEVTITLGGKSIIPI
jgi:hypothetical protein